MDTTRKHSSLFFLLLVALAALFAWGLAGPALAIGPTLSFGGRVISTAIPSVTCPNMVTSTAPVVLTSNLVNFGIGVGIAVTGGVTSQSAGGKAASIAGGTLYGLYSLIPYQFNHVQWNGVVRLPPRPGQQVLGRYQIIPNFTSCFIPAGPVEIPFPVKNTTIYNTSKI